MNIHDINFAAESLANRCDPTKPREAAFAALLRRSIDLADAWREATRLHTIQKITERCVAAGVERVIAADHYRMMFLLSCGPLNNGGITYRDDSLTITELRALAGDVNAALSTITPRNFANDPTL